MPFISSFFLGSNESLGSIDFYAIFIYFSRLKGFYLTTLSLKVKSVCIFTAIVSGSISSIDRGILFSSQGKLYYQIYEKKTFFLVERGMSRSDSDLFIHEVM